MEQANEPKIDKITIKRALWRYNEDGTYNNKPISPTYFRDYYNEKWAIKVECPLCGKFTNKEKLKRHQRSTRCSRPNTQIHDITEAQWDYIKRHIDESDTESPESILLNLRNDTLRYVTLMPPDIQEFIYKTVPVLVDKST